MAKTPLEIKSLARAHTESAIKTLVGIMQQDSAPAAARVTAAQVLLNRGWGMPEQKIEGDVAVTYVARMPARVAGMGEWQQQYAPTKPPLQ
jgi:hypothetical protein